MNFRPGWVALVVSLIALIGGVFAYASVSSSLDNVRQGVTAINESQNTEKLTDSYDAVLQSTVYIKIRTDSITLNQQMEGVAYVDDQGVGWTTGTGFSIGKGLILSAAHVLGNANVNDIFLVWNGTEYNASVVGYGNAPGTDLVIIKTNLDIPPAKIISTQRTAVGSDIAFIGYPLATDFGGALSPAGKPTPILNRGIISAMQQDDPIMPGFFWYKINSFVNHGNSGGPVFLASSGEVVGIISSRQNDVVMAPNFDLNKMTEGEQAILFVVGQLAQNQQVGLGNIIGLNQDVVNGILVNVH